MPKWTQADIPDLSGRIAVVTGASSGIGQDAAEQLARHGARVVLAVRDLRRGDATRARILASAPRADVAVSLLDLASLASVRDFAARTAGDLPQLDILLNNAGLGMQPKRAVTVDGFERQFGTNVLGHFALTALLVPALLRAPAPRVVTIASIAHRRGRIDFDDLQSERRYDPMAVYAQSKLADLMFALELDRRARAQGSRLASLAAHPGLARTGFFVATGMPRPLVALGSVALHVAGQGSLAGALPGLYAATMPGAQGGQYWGPDGLLEFRGAPRLARIEPHAKDQSIWKRLWTAAEGLTGVPFPPLASPLPVREGTGEGGHTT